ncbi:hypothetical protein [Microbacterium sediminis]|uniref:Uncharacterized protein n=1 Tax=Microbacterium sediminis TaxID=904291 RepID=A0A1B9N972_9MICO|nr:hypothetical protein [Microbacterium sediminis]OCG73136.1 hypothetical protein A7J15_09340 [Microbacterium sediminis]QBR74483.1 hypothetical protein E3O41_08825 [Microbacterium sediminis]
MTIRPAALAAIAALGLALAGCAGEAPAPADDPAGGGATTEPAPAATVAPEPDATPTAPAEPTCETIISPYVVAEFDDLGWSAREDPFVLGATELPDALQCIWGDLSVASDHVQMYGWAPVDAETAAAAQSTLEGEGWVRLEESGVTYLTENPEWVVMADDEGYGMTYEFGDGWVAMSDTKQGLEIIQWPPD